MKHQTSVTGPTNIICIPPLEPHLQVMVFKNSGIEFPQQLIRLRRAQLVNLFRERPESEQTFPAGDWVRSYNRMDGGQVRANV